MCDPEKPPPLHSRLCYCSSRSHPNARRCDGDGGLRARWYGNVRPRCVSLTALTLLRFQQAHAASLSGPSVILKAKIALMSLVQGGKLTIFLHYGHVFAGYHQQVKARVPEDSLDPTVRRHISKALNSVYLQRRCQYLFSCLLVDFVALL